MLQNSMYMVLGFLMGPHFPLKNKMGLSGPYLPHHPYKYRALHLKVPLLPTLSLSISPVSSSSLIWEMENQLSVRCKENQSVASYLWTRRNEIAENSKGKDMSVNRDSTIAAAYRNICEARNPICNLKDLSQIK